MKSPVDRLFLLLTSLLIPFGGMADEVFLKNGVNSSYAPTYRHLSIVMPQ
jgi:hypothetical protein